MNQSIEKNANHRALQRTERALQSSRQAILDALSELNAGKPGKAKQALNRYAKEAGLKP